MQNWKAAVSAATAALAVATGGLAYALYRLSREVALAHSAIHEMEHNIAQLLAAAVGN